MKRNDWWVQSSVPAVRFTTCVNNRETAFFSHYQYCVSWDLTFKARLYSLKSTIKTPAPVFVFFFKICTNLLQRLCINILTKLKICIKITLVKILHGSRVQEAFWSMFTGKLRIYKEEKLSNKWMKTD